MWKAIETIHTLAFIKESLAGIWNFAISPTGNIVVILCGLVWLSVIVFWPARHDPRTLRGKTLILRNRIQDFLDQIGPMPTTEPERFGGVSQTHIGIDWRDPDAPLQNSAIKRARGTNLRAAKIEYGYELYFAKEVLEIYREFGFRGVRETSLHKVLFVHESEEGNYKDEADLREIISALSRLAETKEAESQITPSVHGI